MFRRRLFRRRRVFRRRFTSRRARSRRIFKKFIRRRAIRPELKNNVSTVVISAGVSVGTNLTNWAITDRLAVGTGISNRIGGQVNFVKVDLGVKLTNNSSQLAGAAPIRHSAECRVIVWSPRIDITQATTFMASISSTHDMVDPNAVTVHRDRLVQLSPTYTVGSTAGTVVANAGNAPYSRTLKFKIKYPRKVMFGNASTNPNGLFDDEKHGIYVTVYAIDLAILVSWTGRLFFFDA